MTDDAGRLRYIDPARADRALVERLSVALASVDTAAAASGTEGRPASMGCSSPQPLSSLECSTSMKIPIDGASRVALTADDIARMFGAKCRTLYRLVAAGEFPRSRADRDRTPSRPHHATLRDPRAACGAQTDARRTTKCNG